MPSPNLNGVIVAFDLDNTLLEFEREDYARIVNDFLSYNGGMGVPPRVAYHAYESIRSWGNVMERLGLANASHQRGHAHALAMLACMWGSAARPHFPPMPSLSRDVLRSTLGDLEQRERQARQGLPADRLAVELDLRRRISSEHRLHELAEHVRTAARDPALLEWAAQYGIIERSYEVRDFGTLIDDLAERGARVVVITHGRIETQMAKIQRLGLVTRLAERVLITESAAMLPGRDAFHEELDRHLEECASSGARPHASLEELWLAQCVLHEWGRKSPGFFARCLHAVVQDRDRPAAALRALDVVRAKDWSKRPPRFVMIGDRHDLDVAPLRSLLGPRGGLAVLLTQGKHGDGYTADRIPTELRPDRSYPQWTELEAFLRFDLCAAGVPPVGSPPDFFAGMNIDPGQLAKGKQSPFETVRAVARLASEMLA